MVSAGIISHPLMFAVPVAALFAFSSGANAQTRPPIFGGAVVTISQALMAQQASALSFGRVLPTNEAGEMTVSPDGQVSCTSGLWCDPHVSPASFKMTGADDLVVVSVPDAVHLNGPGSESLTLRPMLSSPQIILVNGQATVSIGGTLSIGAHQAAGNYSGSYEINFEYQ